ncbi:MAG: glutamate--cysteine ligase [Flavobacteriales bacterium]|jgi:gamma-glutamyl:cysteine ligase YbdK (ATP-grasp superfamily)|nr:glutamate--cysteine ligase [Flavobacteriales bacterium]MBK9515480.1 glutamate--cysteine ligase [Flavobacteriales bacterium]HOZ40380.1 glutamate-cysteine ligase family protein [Flavobacteriales bacterium]
MSDKKQYKLFEVTGIELEYMVVDRDTLKVLPIVDKLFEDVTGAITSDVERGDVEWSNELVSHVVELKTAKPTKKIPTFRKKFHSDVKVINAVLAKRNAMLLPTAAHPFMDPFTETVIWPHEYNEVYALYNRIFDCRGHGWSNLQSTHLNLPFANDDEFSKLHAAIRLLLPIIPALSASSPILDGTATGFLDSRMEAYLHHQEKLPELMGSLIPEAVFSQEDYYRTIFSPIAQAMAPFDTENVMDHHFANSRGAIARFDRGAIEIRVIDIQECPAADLAIAELIVAVLKALTSGRWVSSYLQRAWSENDLLPIFLQVIKDAGGSVIANRDYLLMFGLMKQDHMHVGKLWQHLFVELYGELSENCRQHVGHILEHGCLASRILKRTGRTPSHDDLVRVYRELADCLQEDRQLV